MKKISVCVPSYNRPDTLETLIKTFLKQDYKNKELVISDDSPNDSIKDLVKSFKNRSLKFYRNSPGLGFSKNYLQSMLKATGDYLITIGDDDIILRPDVLSTYVKIFNENPKVSYIYANLIQFSNDMKVEYIIETFPKNTYFKKGNEAMFGLWTTSIFIGGIGIRNTPQLKKLYPLKKILHPQVEMIGNIINKHDAFGLSKYCIGVRSHQDQIIFRALKNKKIRQDGKHMNVELFEILGRLKKKYKMKYSNHDLAAKLVPQTLIMMFKEKSILGNAEMKKNHLNFLKQSSKLQLNKKLSLTYIAARLIPGFFVNMLRSSAIKVTRIRQKKSFNIYQKQILKITR